MAKRYLLNHKDDDNKKGLLCNITYPCDKRFTSRITEEAYFVRHSFNPRQWTAALCQRDDHFRQFKYLFLTIHRASYSSDIPPVSFVSLKNEWHFYVDILLEKAPNDLCCDKQMLRLF